MMRAKFVRPAALWIAFGALVVLSPQARPQGADRAREARALLSRARYAQAESLCRVALAAGPARTREDSLASAALLDALAESFWRRASAVPPDADSLSSVAVAWRARLHGVNSLERAASLTHRARVLRKFGRTSESVEIMRDVLRDQARGGASDSALAMGEAATARMFSELGLLDSAQVFDFRALDRRERALGPAHTDVGKSLNSVALNYARVGRMADARDYYDRARTTFANAHPVDSTALLAVDENLTGALLAVGRAHEAYAVAMEADAIARRLGGEGALNENLASALWDTGRSDSSLLVYREVIRQHAASGRRLNEARALMMLADRLASRAPSDDALRTAQAADSLCRSLGVRGVQNAETKLVLSNILAQRGDYLQARAAADSAVAECGASLSFERASGLRATHNAGWVRFAQGDDAQALPLEFESCRRTLGHLRLWYRAMSEDDALQYDTRVPPYGYAIAASIVAAAPSDSSVAALWDVTIAMRSLVLDELARRRWASDADARTDSLEAARRNATRALAGLLLSGGERRAEGAPRIAALRVQVQLLERAIAARVRPWLEQEEEAPVGHAKIAAALAPDQVLVAYTVFLHWRADSACAEIAANRDRGFPEPTATWRHAKQTLAAFVQRPGEAPRFTVLGALADIERAADAYRAALAREVARSEAGSAASDRAGGRLRRLVWDPIASLAGDAREIVVVPDGPLLLLSPATFPDGRGHYLIESGPPIVLLDTERDLVRRGRRAVRGEGLLALGAPDYSQAARPAARGGVISRLRAAPERCEEWTRARFAPLPGSANEVLGVRATWLRTRTQPQAPDREARCLLGREASEAAFKSLAPGQRALHVAAHGFSPRRDCPSDSGGVGADPLLRSGLVLAGANRPDPPHLDGEDGWLTAAEISTLDLSAADCVVLSACNSDTGAVRYGEGVFGLRRALALAGAGSTVMSLWAVDDLATNRWMKFFYEAWLTEGLAPTEAVHRASLALLRERRAQGRSTSPAFWGAFVATGARR